jgi:predicted TIM-barrel fold metal-dependent hydrolase
MNRELSPEPVIEPDLPIVDPHHHLWLQDPAKLKALEGVDDQGGAILRVFGTHPRYLLDDFLADVTAGHNVRATVFLETHAMYRADGPQELKSVGEVEFANGMAAMVASGLFGDVRICAGIVGCIDLRLGDGVQKILAAHRRAGGDRYRGVRPPGVCYEPSLNLFSAASGAIPHVLLDAAFRTGAKHVAAEGLSLDVFAVEPQLPEVLDLARALPDLQIVLDHTGTPLGIGPFAGTLGERYPIWRDNIRLLAQCPNVVVKLGGLGMPCTGISPNPDPTPASSETLADAWRPYIEACIEAFGADRCMFESNYPVEGATASYPVIWNVFKRAVSGASRSEKLALFHDTAARIYRLDA